MPTDNQNMPDEARSFFRQNAELLVLIGLAALTLAVYWQTVGFGFINLDDNLYVYQNPYVLSGLNWQTVVYAFSDFQISNYHPLTLISHALDVSISGANAGAHHATNIIFHLLDTILAFFVFRRYTGAFWKSAIVAALFAVHPAHVESVAWISERKDVLSTLFWFLTMWSYLIYTRRDRNIKWYLLTGVLLTLGLLAKPMPVTLPFVLLLMDYWVLERLENWRDLPKLLLEKIPFFALSILAGVITIFAQRSAGSMQSLEKLSLESRFSNAVISYVKYIGMLFYPTDMAVWYPYQFKFAWWQIAGSILLLVVVSAVCVRQIRRRKYLLAGWLWFLGTLVPVIGILQVGAQPMADRYSYIPYFGLFIMLVWGIGELLEKFRVSQKIIAAGVAVVLLIFSVAAYRQTARWQNNETLFRHALAVTNDNYLVMQNLCHALLFKNELDEAENFCRESIAVNPNYMESYNTLGIIQTKRGQFDQAIENFKTTLKINPDYIAVYSNLAVAESLAGEADAAENDLQKLIQLSGGAVSPNIIVNIRTNLALYYANERDYEKSARQFAEILEIDPNNADARANYALILFYLRRVDEARNQIEQAIRLKPDSADAYNNYGIILLGQDKKEEAARQFETALEINPNYAPARENLEKTQKKK